VTKAVQYGNGIKGQSVYLSQYQLIPYNRVQEHFQEQLDLPISEESIFTYNQQAYELLEQFEQNLIVQLLHTRVIHADETGINISGKTAGYTACPVPCGRCITRIKNADWRQWKAYPC
jgi:transposase